MFLFYFLVQGCKVIGSTGSDEKVNYLKEELGFDEAYNYKTVTPDKLKEELKKLAPDGIDVFLEGVSNLRITQNHTILDQTKDPKCINNLLLEDQAEISELTRLESTIIVID